MKGVMAVLVGLGSAAVLLAMMSLLRIQSWQPRLSPPEVRLSLMTPSRQTPDPELPEPDPEMREVLEASVPVRPQDAPPPAQPEVITSAVQMASPQVAVWAMQVDTPILQTDVMRPHTPVDQPEIQQEPRVEPRVLGQGGRWIIGPSDKPFEMDYPTRDGATLQMQVRLDAQGYVVEVRDVTGGTLHHRRAVRTFMRGLRYEPTWADGSSVEGWHAFTLHVDGGGS